MFGWKGHGFVSHPDEFDVVEKMIKSWRPFVKRVGYDALVKTDTGEIYRNIHVVECSDKMAEVIQKQIQAMHPEEWAGGGTKMMFESNR